MKYKIIIPGQLPGLNEYINAERSNRYKAAKIKKDAGNLVEWACRAQLGRIRLESPVIIHYRWIEPNAKRDRDNIAFAKKFVQDALVHAGYLPNDGWHEIKGFTDDFAVDKSNPRVEIEIEEV